MRFYHFGDVFKQCDAYDTFQAAIAVSLPFEDEIHSDQTNWPKLKVLVAN